MKRGYYYVLVGVGMVGLLVGLAPARQDGKNNDFSRPLRPSNQATVKVEKGTIKVDVTLKGTLEAKNSVELSIRPEAWTLPLVVKKAVEHGATVKKGDVLVEIDAEKIDQAIRDLRLDRDVAEIAIRQGKEELPLLEKSVPLDLAQAELAKKQADEDLKQFLDVDRRLAEENAEQILKSSVFSLENAREELKQLQKMYRDKDLTEETEEIILKRQRRAVEAAEHYLKSSKIRREETLKVSLPRQEQRLRDGAIKQALALEKANNTLRLTVSQKRLALDKLRYEHEKSGDRLKNLERDRELLTVRAPSDGVVYYGKCVHGQWATMAVAETKLQTGGVLMPGEVFMTVLAAKPIFVRATVEEKDLHLLHSGLTGKATPAGYPDCKIPARLIKVSHVPEKAGSFDARVALETGKDAEMLMPGMACTVKLTAYQKNNALTVPASAVFADEDADEDAHYVLVPGGKNGKPEKRTVKLGKKTGKKVEILDGLREGDEILANKPEEKSSTGSTSKPAQEN